MGWGQLLRLTPPHPAPRTHTAHTHKKHTHKTHTGTHTYTKTHTHALTPHPPSHTHTHTHTHRKCTHTDTHRHKHKHTNVHTQTRARMRARTHTHKHTLTHTHKEWTFPHEGTHTDLKSEVLRSLRHYLRVQSQRHDTIDRLERKAWNEEALVDLPWKGERGPSSIRRTLEPSRRQRWGKLLRDGVERIWDFLSAWIPPGSGLIWTELRCTWLWGILNFRIDCFPWRTWRNPLILPIPSISVTGNTGGYTSVDKIKQLASNEGGHTGRSKQGAPFTDVDWPPQAYIFLQLWLPK